MTTEPTREEVQGLLEAMELSAKYGEQNATLIALCRAWLALHDAPSMRITDQMYGYKGWCGRIQGEYNPDLQGKTVRLVAVQGGGDGSR